jgi:PPK2 family polyphosphate:nucleotide phosphotransferase
MEQSKYKKSCARLAGPELWFAVTPSQFQFAHGEKIGLHKWPTRIKRIHDSKLDYEAALSTCIARLSERQQQLYATGSRAVLVVFQGMDTSGKDGIIRHVLSGLNPQGCKVTSFKQPSMVELRHDFLWRAAVALPERGQVGVFNRSYYEDVIVPRVHPQILAPQNLSASNKLWKQRYRSINAFEQHICANGTVIVKFFLHLSKDVQRDRLLARIDEPSKNWKIEDSDVTERGFWNAYLSAYGQCLAATSTKVAPWFVIPADDKENARLIVARLLLNVLEGLDIKMPTITLQRRSALRRLRNRLSKG